MLRRVQYLDGLGAQIAAGILVDLGLHGFSGTSPFNKDHPPIMASDENASVGNFFNLKFQDH